MQYASSAYTHTNMPITCTCLPAHVRTMATCMALQSASLYTPTVLTPSCLAVRMTLQAISPRLATRILSNSSTSPTVPVEREPTSWIPTPSLCQFT